MQLTLNIPDELIALAQKYAPELILRDAKNAAKRSIYDLVINKVKDKINSDSKISIEEIIENIMSNEIT